MVATQHSGTGKANQYFLRGFNLDHGTDFATFVDDMPVSGSRELLKEIQHRLSERFKIIHSTIQFECERCVENGACPLPEDVKNHR